MSKVYYCDWCGRTYFQDNDDEELITCEDDGTKLIVFPVYTQSELDEKLGYIEGLFTPEELNAAVEAEREVDIKLFNDLSEKCQIMRENGDSDMRTVKHLIKWAIKAIRARSKQ